jgi:PII-like signaling protein
MNGFMLTFLTQQDRKHDGQPLAEWILRLARDMGMRGATLRSANEGYGRDRHVHSAHFFELADQPLEVMLAATAEEADRLLARLRSEGIRIFYIKAPIEFGILGEGDA